MSEQDPAGAARSRKGWLWRGAGFVLLAAGMTVAAGVGLYVALFFALHGREVVVPDLTNMTEDEARAALATRQLSVEVSGHRSDPRTNAGRVLEQEPPPRARTRPQRAIRVVLSAGAQTIEVPSFVGGTARMAQIELKRRGLRLGSVAHAPSAQATVDEVLAQRPAPGANRQKGDVVDLLVSRGLRERVYVMPSLKGLSVERATTILADGGVKTSVTKAETRSGAQPGSVLDQTPPEGYPVRQRETVHLVVAP